MNFNDDIILRLCTLKNVPVKGNPHFSEFTRDLENQCDVYAINEDASGSFDFKIDSVSHVSWFRKKSDEWQEAMGIPKLR